MINSNGEPLALRAVIRDTYINLFDRGYAIDRMAYADYDYLHKTVGRIQVVEELALGLVDTPKHFELSQEEDHYMKWLKEFVNARKQDQFFGDRFLHGMSSETPPQLLGAVA